MTPYTQEQVEDLFAQLREAASAQYDLRLVTVALGFIEAQRLQATFTNLYRKLGQHT